MQYQSMAILLPWYIMVALVAHALVIAWHIRIVHAREHLRRFHHERKRPGQMLRGLLMGYNSSAIHTYCVYKAAQGDNHRKVLPPTDCWVGSIKRIWSAQGSSSCVATSVSGRNQGIHCHLQPCPKGRDLHGRLGSPQNRQHSSSLLECPYCGC